MAKNHSNQGGGYDADPDAEIDRLRREDEANQKRQAEQAERQRRAEAERNRRKEK